MSMAAAVEVKGWCPGVLRPMQSGDGLIARVRPWCGALGLDEARGLADAAQRFGNGHIDFTRRANLQIRGLSDASVHGLQDAMQRLGLVDRDAEVEAGRNIMVAPLAGLASDEVDVRPIARTLADFLAGDAALYALPSKFGFLVDGGGSVSIACERTDIALRALGQTVAIGLDTPACTDWIGSTSFDGRQKRLSPSQGSSSTSRATEVACAISTKSALGSFVPSRARGWVQRMVACRSSPGVLSAGKDRC
jgi:precorrin-3B synthase